MQAAFLMSLSKRYPVGDRRPLLIVCKAPGKFSRTEFDLAGGCFQRISPGIICEFYHTGRVFLPTGRGGHHKIALSQELLPTDHTPDPRAFEASFDAFPVGLTFAKLPENAQLFSYFPYCFPIAFGFSQRFDTLGF